MTVCHRAGSAPANPRGLGLRTTRDRVRTGVTAAVLTIVFSAAGIVACGPETVEKREKELTPSERIRAAQSMVNANRMRDAIEILERGLAKTPDDASLQVYYGNLCFQVGR